MGLASGNAFMRNPMARPENRSDARSLSLTLPTETFNYLVLLATLGKLGRTENEVAAHILVREAYTMLERCFHENSARGDMSSVMAVQD